MTGPTVNSLPPGGKLFLFPVILLLLSCNNLPSSSSSSLSLIRENGRATGILIPKATIAALSADSLPIQVQIRLLGHGAQPPTAGSFHFLHGDLVFSPLIPFTPGLEYGVFIKDHSAGQVMIPRGIDTPVLVAIYPDGDTVPENLLKIYFRFSRPMMEDQALKYISLQSEQGDSLSHIFLDLHPELWNKDRTVLTLWLDPGRIKRELQPHRSLGPPLVIGKKYFLVVAGSWPDQEGQVLARSYTKTLVATYRDSLCPSLADWIFQIPVRGSSEPFRIFFGKQMDYLLVLDAIHLLGPNGSPVAGTASVGPGERDYFFRPAKPWVPGIYSLQVESRVEDLAGNNLNRPFEQDLSGGRPRKEDSSYHQRIFRIN